MNKKTYNKPLMKVVDLASNELICGSIDGNEPSTFGIFDDYVDEEPQGGVSSDIWGSQW